MKKNNDTNNRRICMSEMLEKARKYEDEQGKQIKAEDGIRDDLVTGVQTCALPIYSMTPDTDQSISV